jgi:hypothetical protein
MQDADLDGIPGHGETGRVHGILRKGPDASETGKRRHRWHRSHAL